MKDKNQKFIVKVKNKRNFKKYLIFTHNEKTNKQFLINFKNNKIQSTFNLENLNLIIKFFTCKWKIIFT